MITVRGVRGYADADGSVVGTEGWINDVTNDTEATGARAGPGWRPDVADRASELEPRLAELLSPDGPTNDAVDAMLGADRVALVPDAHYPFHPSTGMVTDPAVVAALAARLESAGVDVAVVGSSTEFVDADRCARYLGYSDALAGVDASWVDFDAEGADGCEIRRPVTMEGDRISVTVPDFLAERTVVAVPSLRPTAEGTVAGAARALSRAVSRTGSNEEDVSSGRAAAAAMRALDPAGAVLDATRVYAGEPYAAEALLAGDPVAVDAAAAAALGRDPGADDAIALATTDELSVSVDGLDLERLRDDLPEGGLPPSAETHPAVSGAYRLYATVAGDAVPPQIDGGGRS